MIFFYSEDDVKALNNNLFFNNDLYNQHSFSPNKRKVQFNSTTLISKQSSGPEESQDENKKFFFILNIYLRILFIYLKVCW
jgi:hypothetical protein